MNRLFAAIVILVTTTIGVTAGELIMFEAPGCEWCERWDEEIGVIYDKTPEGHRTSLRRVMLSDGTPSDVVLQNPVTYTPTFVLIDANREVGRIVGYPGEDFFWSLLDELVTELTNSYDFSNRHAGEPGADG